MHGVYCEEPSNSPTQKKVKLYLFRSVDGGGSCAALKLLNSEHLFDLCCFLTFLLLLSAVNPVPYTHACRLPTTGVDIQPQKVTL